MDKTEMIDKAIKDLGGDIGKANNGENIKYRYVWKNHLGYWLAGENSVVHHKNEYFCTIEEFEQRKKELEQLNKQAEWYDYENQKALALPPVGTEVEAQLSEKSFAKGTVKAHVTRLGNTYAVFQYEEDWDTLPTECFRPLDWDKLSAKKKLIEEVTKLICQHICIENAVETLYNGGYLKLPEESK